MSEVFEVDGATREALDTAGRALAGGEAVVLPTDTVYGVGARPDLRSATERIFELKRRPRDLTLPVLVAETTDAAAVARLDERAVRLAERFWPGALTLVLPRSSASTGWDLGAHRDTVGVRVPAHPVAAALLARTGPLAVTSANVSGRETPTTCGGVREALGEAVAVYLCAGAALEPVPSTVVELVEEEPRILRAGALPVEELLAAIHGP